VLVGFGCSGCGWVGDVSFVGREAGCLCSTSKPTACLTYKQTTERSFLPCPMPCPVTQFPPDVTRRNLEQLANFSRAGRSQPCGSLSLSNRPRAHSQISLQTHTPSPYKNLLFVLEVRLALVWTRPKRERWAPAVSIGTGVQRTSLFVLSCATCLFSSRCRHR
jgi:hypothetical protein